MWTSSKIWTLLPARLLWISPLFPALLEHEVWCYMGLNKKGALAPSSCSSNPKPKDHWQFHLLHYLQVLATCWRTWRNRAFRNPSGHIKHLERDQGCKKPMHIVPVLETTQWPGPALVSSSGLAQKPAVGMCSHVTVAEACSVPFWMDTHGLYLDKEAIPSPQWH